MTSRAMMKSAQEQWEALQRVTDAAQDVLPEGECRVLERMTRSGATRALDRLDAVSRPDTPTPAGADESTEVRDIKQVLRTAAGV